ncbi:hypothetical protein V6N12_007775 [Hibiscus sabdariffa]|uniref:Uncharacterized protein n=1 Tax=Hibiscus sabdariffa TaxID=183260 RepID=A0ABR2F2S0_9ROSI
MENLKANTIDSFVPSGRPPDGVAGATGPLGFSDAGIGSIVGGGSQMDTMEVEVILLGQSEAVTVQTALGRISEPPVDGRFGPWMQVVNWKRRPNAPRRNMTHEGPTVMSMGGSRFKALEFLGEDDHLRVPGVVGQVEGSIRAEVEVEEVVHGTGGLCIVEPGESVTVDKECDGSGDDLVIQPDREELVVNPRVAAKGKVVHEPSSLQADKHSVVLVVEEGYSRVLKENNGRPLYGSIRSTYVRGEA